MDKQELIEKIRKELAGQSYPCVVEDNCECKEVYHEILSEHRWYNRTLIVFKIDDWYLAFEYDAPATECQEGQDTSPVVYEVEPYLVTETKYRKK